MISQRKGGDRGAFWRNLRKHPGAIGAVVPSSRGLSRRMAEMIDLGSGGKVVELGAGTGAVTNALLNYGLSKERLIVVEYLPEFVDFLRTRFPGVNIIQGDAAQLGEELEVKTNTSLEEVNAIVSSLPLRSLERDKAEEITGEWKKMKSPESKVVQFTYDLRTWKHPTLKDFRCLRTRYALWNLPPARIDLLQRKH